ncbi:MAG: hypothetical protein IKZ98_13360 [Clostridia bacterium]|nr:hypothetical protein [Clostridia bacterium]
MGSFANTLFRVMLGWLQGIVSAVWSAFTSEKGGSLFTWIGNHWIPIAAILCIIGLVSDLGIYLVRWKPYKVWKSFFLRKNEEDEEPVPERRRLANERPVRRREYTAPVQPAYAEEPAESREPEIEKEYKPADFSRWEPEQRKEEKVYQVPRESIPVTVTAAGYHVPADSPYRRPKTEHAPVQEQVQEKEAVPAGKQETGKSQPVLYRRRRRINVTELFSDPEEELRPFEAPQQVINSQEAYHQPVYPRGWKKSEDEKQ